MTKAERLERAAKDIESVLEELRESVDPISCKVEGLLEAAKLAVDAAKDFDL